MKRSVHRLLCAVLGCILLLGVLAGANTAVAETAASGKCGKDLVWTFDPATGVITIEGEGAMWDYDSAKLLPWAAYASNIKKVVIKSGVTSLGRNAFSGCAVEEVEFADTLEAIGQNAFRNCENLAAVDLTNTKVQTIAAGAFVGCEKLTTDAVKLPETVVSVSATAFEEKVEVKKELIKQNPVVAPAETTETADRDKHWTQVNGEFVFEYTELPDGTLICVAYENGEVYFRSTTTYGSDGRCHDEMIYTDGRVTIDDWMVDANDNLISGEQYYYDENKVLTKKRIYWNENNVRYERNYDSSNTLLSETERTTDENSVTTSTYTYYEQNGEVRTVKEVLWYDDDGWFHCKVYENDANGKSTREETSVRLDDGTYRRNTVETDENSTRTSESIGTSDYKLIRENYEIKFTDGSVQKGQKVGDGDGTITDKTTCERDGVTYIEWETTYEETSGKVLKRFTTTKNKNGEIVQQMDETGVWNQDGTFTTTNVTTAKDSGGIAYTSTWRTTMDSENKTLEYIEETKYEDGTSDKTERKQNADGSWTTSKEYVSTSGDVEISTKVVKDGVELSFISESRDKDGKKFAEETRSTVVNEDGTVTKISNKSDGNGKTASKRTEDASGNLVELSEITYDENGNGYEKIYDKDNNLIWEGTEGTRPAGSAQTLELPQGMPVAVEPEEEPTKEQPTGEKTTEEEPTEEEPTEEEPTEEQPTEEKPDEEQPSEEQPSEEQPTEQQPTEEEPAEEKPGEEQPTEEKPTEEQPTEEQPTEEKPTQEQPAEQPKGESEAAVLPAVGEKIAVVIAA